MKKTIIGIVGTIVLVILFFFVFKNKFYGTASDIPERIEQKETMLLFVTGKNCYDCNDLEKFFDKQNIKYVTLNKDKDKSYDSILKKLNITDSEIAIPSLIYIQDGQLVSTLVGVTEAEATLFLDNYGVPRN